MQTLEIITMIVALLASGALATLSAAVLCGSARRRPPMSMRDMPQYSGPTEPIGPVIHPVLISEETFRHIFGPMDAGVWSDNPMQPTTRLSPEENP